MTYPHADFDSNRVPLAYFISFRCYGTWLHGDKRGSVDRFHNCYGSPMISRNDRWRGYNLRTLKRPPVGLDRIRRAAVKAAIREMCRVRNWLLWALNIRTNHVHTVVTAACDPERVLNAFKANATREMREKGCWDNSETPWVKRGSKRRLWNHKQVAAAIAYVEYDQGEPLP